MQWTAAYVGGKIEILTKLIEQAYSASYMAEAVRLETTFESLMVHIDALLSAYPTTDLQSWIDRARAYGTSDEQADEYESNARRIVTIWGPPVDDYSARIWGDLIRDYYLQRWKHYFEQKKSEHKFDFSRWEAQWVANTKGLSAVDIPNNLPDASLALLRDASTITDRVNENSIIATWNKSDFEDGAVCNELKWNISSGVLKNVKGFRFHCNEGSIVISSVSIWADSMMVKEAHGNENFTTDCTIAMDCSKRISGNNSLELRVSMRLTDSRMRDN